MRSNVYTNLPNTVIFVSGKSVSGVFLWGGLMGFLFVFFCLFVLDMLSKTLRFLLSVP